MPENKGAPYVKTIKKFMFISIALSLIVVYSGCSQSSEMYMDKSDEVLMNKEMNIEESTGAPEPRMAMMNLAPSVDIISESETSDYFSYDIEYPVVSGLMDQLVEESLNQRFKEQVLNHVDSLKKTSQSRPVDHYSRPYKAYTSFEIKTVSPEFISLFGIFGDYTGGAHGNYYANSYNINMITGESVPLDFFFKDDFDYKQVINGEISNQIKNSPDDTMYFKEKGLRFESIGEMQQYFVEDGNLVITFGVYEIAPYATGIPEFIIPMEKIENGLREEIKWMLNNNL